jgi:hypothetical protein
MNVLRMGLRCLFVASCIGVILLETSCLPDYFPRRQVKERVLEDEVTGRWHLTDESSAMLNRQNVAIVKGEDSAIELFADERCVLNRFAYGDELISGNGTWKIEHDVDEGGGSIKRNELQVKITSDKKGGVCFFNFSRKHKRLFFWQYYGDPDGRRYIDYVHD